MACKRLSKLLQNTPSGYRQTLKTCCYIINNHTHYWRSSHHRVQTSSNRRSHYRCQPVQGFLRQFARYIRRSRQKLRKSFTRRQANGYGRADGCRQSRRGKCHCRHRHRLWNSRRTRLNAYGSSKRNRSSYRIKTARWLYYSCEAIALKLFCNDNLWALGLHFHMVKRATRSSQHRLQPCSGMRGGGQSLQSTRPHFFVFVQATLCYAPPLTQWFTHNDFRHRWT